jgi:hypothetical protein
MKAVRVDCAGHVVVKVVLRRSASSMKVESRSLPGQTPLPTRKPIPTALSTSKNVVRRLGDIFGRLVGLSGG